MENIKSKTISYEEEKIQQLINMLNTIPISGYVQVKTMNNVFDILANPLPIENEVKECKK